MAEALVDEFRPPIGQPHPVEAIELVPAGKGMYEVYVDGRQVYSKLETGQHISSADAVRLIRAAYTQP